MKKPAKKAAPAKRPASKKPAGRDAARPAKKAPKGPAKKAPGKPARKAPKGPAGKASGRGARAKRQAPGRAARPRRLAEPEDTGLVIMEHEIEVDRERVNEERRAYLEEARSQDASE